MQDQKDTLGRLDGNAREKLKENEALLSQLTELQQSNASLREFAFVASHDLKEPLRKISTLGDRLVQTERNNLSETGKAYVDKIIGAAERMQQLIDDLLSLSQISSDLRFENADLNDLLSDALQNFEPTIESMKALIRADKLPVVKVVRSQFRLLFQNLVSNSLKFASKDRTPVLTIRCKQLSPDEVQHLNVRKALSYVQLTFADNGIGFDSRFADKIFATFQRLNSKSEYAGAGIGLAICWKIVENHGGIIHAASTPKEGSEFTIVIPVA